MPDPSPHAEEVLQRLEQERARLQADWLRHIDAGAPPAFAELFRAAAAALLNEQGRLRELQAGYYRDLLALWSEEFAVNAKPPAADEPESDPRFSAPEWREIPWFRFLRRSYALAARWLHELLDTVHADEPTRRRLRFFGRQYIAAAAPSNFAPTNPEVVKLALASRGDSLKRGLQNLQADADKGRVSMTDETSFEVGRNLAVTPGAVVYENALIQLLQYRPTTASVYARPLLIVPPFINKYYILDLQPENSFVRHAVDGGLTVFVVSWRNIQPSLGQLGWDDYIEQGVLAALETVRAIVPRQKVNTLGFCVGGTLLACALAVLRNKGAQPAASLTLLASMLDFSDTGEISVYVDEAYVTRCEAELGRDGVVPGSRLAAAFASLRPDDLVWRYVVNNYLKGLKPPAFDLLYWNSDSANLPGPLYAYYLRNMYLENALREPCRLSMCGAPVDLGVIGLPSYVLATSEDHIVPWHTAYASAKLLGKDVTFVLASSGHIAGVVSPPHQWRRSFRAGPLVHDADGWLARATQSQGSWWPHWLAWIAARSGKRIAAREGVGNIRFPEIEPAPGRYANERAG